MNRTTKQLTKMALLVALLCVSAYISVPAPWGGIITSLTLVMCLVAFMLSPKDTFVTLVVYDLMGAIGLPVFAGGAGGFSVILSPWGGFILGWPIAYTALSLLKGKRVNFISYAWRAVLVSIPILYIIAVPYFMWVSGNQLTNPEQWYATGLSMIGFIPGDIIKAIIAAWLATKIRV